MDRAALVQVFDQVLQAYDIPKPETVVKVKKEDAVALAENLPYSLITNLAHTVMWQRLWLNKLAGGRKNSNMSDWKQDWRVPSPDEWESLRSEFVSGFKEARRIAASEPFDHKCTDDAEAVETLVRIAVHGVYHIGQMNLLKRSTKTKPD